MADLLGERWERSLKMTPKHWRHVRIVDADKGIYSVLSFYVSSRFGPLALAALGIDPNTKTEGISKAAAMTLGETLEKKMIANNEAKPARKRGS